MVALDISHAARRPEDAPRTPAPRPALSGRRAGGPAIPKITVDGIRIDRRTIAAEMQNFPATDPDEALRRAATALIVRRLLLAEAERLGLTAVPETDADGRRETDEDALLRALVETEVTVPEPTEEELRRWFEANRRRFVTAPLWEADHVLIAADPDDAAARAAARQRATTLRAEIDAAPELFAEVARAVSDCPSGALGGSLGQISAGETAPEFEAALARLEPGELSEPVETRWGVHLVRLRRRIEGRDLPFEAVRERIAAHLGESVRRRATAQYIGRLVGRAEIVGFDLASTGSPLVQ
ncbi:MAG: peptidylprolyl isomerase [Phyllobacteriaceae bacterium]|nr:peptidylprolyl isomerase [Phyllobacteriaceae bacterium]